MSYKEKKSYMSQQPAASPLDGKNQTPRNYRKSPPRLAPKILIPETRKETIHRNVQVERPKPFRKLHRTKESFAKASKRGPEGEDGDRGLEENQRKVGRYCDRTQPTRR